VCRFVPRWGRRYLLRNHQKLALADEARVIVGGFNIEDSYFGTIEQAAWRDLGLLVEGPAASRLVGYYDALSNWARRPRGSLRKLA
ncbi:phosphatidylserine/phosphatidylglycerophosphate/cardiolipin synthase family protein, partial [Escherichia coli]|nr:phosphatidylserine/phosphatidylglycerophosphate/cardiolipin synthase family protein [Escherichia coli]